MAIPAPLSLSTISAEEGPEQFLSCSLGSNTQVLLPVVQLVEVFNFSREQITPIPHLPHWIQGVYNWRGEVLWVVHLAQLLGLASNATAPSPHRAEPMLTVMPSQPQMVVLQGEEHATMGTWTMLGLEVDQAGDLEWFTPSHIQSPPATAFTPTLAQFLRGYWLKDTGEIFLCPSIKAILAAMPQVNQS